jgi:endoglucanase
MGNSAMTEKYAKPGLLFAFCAALLVLSGCSGGGGGGGGGSSSSSGSAGATSGGPFIVVDQFGYLPTAQKVAVIRDPQTGFDAADSYAPGDTFEVVNDDNDTVVFSGPKTPWNSGATDSSSGDRAWWFDFSGVTVSGNYFVRDAEHGVVSPVFAINSNVYKEVLKQAMRTLFYQRAGHAKQTPYAEAAWADGASHLGSLQDSQARLYTDPNNDAGSQKDLHGGWYDAGDYNKYTNWTADYVIGLLHIYLENSTLWNSPWGDDLNIPESDNDIPDILDEVKWGMDWLIRMQNDDGSVLSIVDLAHASPPSAATGPSRYGPANTSATLTTAAAFALGAKVFGSMGDEILDAYADNLQTRAINAWTWANANPAVLFQNNDGSNNLGAGQQEVNDNGRVMKKLEAATYLFELTGESTYKTYFESNYTSAEIIGSSNFANEFSEHIIHFLLYYANLPGVTTSVRNDIRNKFVSAMNGGTVWGAINNETHSYRAPLLAYTWGSAGVKANKGSMFYEHILYGLTPQSGQTDEQIRNVAARYIHYLHGVNPLGKVYLSNMGAYGAENSVDQFYHTWFQHGSALWDSVSGSTHGPAPGFVVGGPNPSYNRDNCCNTTCGSPANNNMCLLRPSPPFGQPNQKSYADFNESWPLNSWSVTENSNGYQIRYLRLLSKFVQ